MGDKSHIEWTDATWNPVRGCSLVSSGCTNCYAMKVAGGRAKKHYEGLTRPTEHGPVWTGDVRLVPELLDLPLHWKQPRRIFVNSMSDLFHEKVPDEFIDQVFAVMALASRHVFQVLTKRPERMRSYFEQDPFDRIPDLAYDIWTKRVAPGAMGSIVEWWERGEQYIDVKTLPLPNVWLGVSVEDQKTADERIPILLQTPAAVRWISAEPLLGAIDLTELKVNQELIGREWKKGEIRPVSYPVAIDALRGSYFTNMRLEYETDKRLDWVVAGGESGHGARPMHPDWARSLRDQCAAAGVPFLFKQWGSWAPGENVERKSGIVDSAKWFNDKWSFGRENLANEDGHIDDQPDLYRVGKKAAGRLLDGREWNEYPALRYGSEALPTQGERKEEAAL